MQGRVVCDLLHCFLGKFCNALHLLAISQRLRRLQLPILLHPHKAQRLEDLRDQLAKKPAGVMQHARGRDKSSSEGRHVLVEGLKAQNTLGCLEQDLLKMHHAGGFLQRLHLLPQRANFHRDRGGLGIPEGAMHEVPEACHSVVVARRYCFAGHLTDLFGTVEHVEEASGSPAYEAHQQLEQRGADCREHNPRSLTHLAEILPYLYHEVLERHRVASQLGPPTGYLPNRPKCGKKRVQDGNDIIVEENVFHEPLHEKAHHERVTRQWAHHAREHILREGLEHRTRGAQLQGGRDREDIGQRQRP
mmetsp:Transcript_108551/g.231835  ORF Transcript_108551/g.231835 Transcript_108551/m.231835 type:complete len:304 (-) Transcript_108551:973-1884(-)